MEKIGSTQISGGRSGRAPITRALFFAGIILGTDWLLFNLFFLVFVGLPVLNVVMRVLLDLPFISLGAFAGQGMFGWIAETRIHALSD